MPDSLSEILIRLLIISILIFANAFFVSSEFAFVRVRRTRLLQLAREGNKTASILNYEIDNIAKFIAAVQLGVTMSSLALGWVGEATLASLLYPIFNFIPEIGRLITTHTVSGALAFILITTLHVVLGELTPKSIALQYPEKTALFVARPMLFITKLFSPIVLVLNNLGTIFLNLFKVPPATGIHLVHSAEELDMLINASYQEGILTSTERDILHNVFKFSDLIARKIMIPRPDVISIPQDISINDLIELITEHQFTRYPVYQDDLDHILGIVHMKDIIPFIEQKENFELDKIIRSPILVPETLTIDKLLIQFKKSKSQMAIIIDEFGGTSGIVTLEDVLEEVFGEVHDEFDVEEPDVKILSENEFIINAMMRIDKINELFNTDIQEEEIETIGGVVLKALGRVANPGDTINIQGYSFKVEKVDGPRITSLKLKKLVIP